VKIGIKGYPTFFDGVSEIAFTRVLRKVTEFWKWTKFS